MEHVLHNVSENLTDEQKVELADAFAEQYEKEPEKFIEFMESEEVAVAGSYSQTWSVIQEDTNSLKRHSNLRVLLEQEDLMRGQEE